MSRPRELRTKVCVRCGEVFAEKIREGREEFERRPYCSTRCRAAAHRKTLPPRNCPVCGALLVQRENETNYDFRTRKTCGWGCAMHYVGRVAHIASRVVERPMALEPATVPQMRYEDDPRAVAERGVALHVLPPPQIERGCDALGRIMR